MDKYKNISTSPSYVKIKIRDRKKIINLICDNQDLSAYLIEEGIVDIENYASYMQQNQGQIFEIELNDFGKFIGKRRFDNEQSGIKYVRKLIIEGILTLNDLDANSADDLLNKYFNLSTDATSYILKDIYYEKYNMNPSFIALLIDLGFDVFREDYVPILSIKKK